MHYSDSRTSSWNLNDSKCLVLLFSLWVIIINQCGMLEYSFVILVYRRHGIFSLCSILVNSIVIATLYIPNVAIVTVSTED